LEILVIKGGKVVTPKGIVEAGIAIKEEKIVAVAKEQHLPKADKEIDARGRYVFPGGVDAHAHIYDPKHVRREDFKTGTMAAAAGGITSIVEMILQSPVDNPDRIRQKIAVGERESLVDFSLHAGMMNNENVKWVPEIVRLGVASFKAFMCAPYRVDENSLSLIMEKVAAHLGIVNVHAEDEKTVWELTEKLKREGRVDPLAHNESRPSIAEERAVSNAISLASSTGAHLHISHLTTRGGARLVEEAKRNGVHVTTETCPHYLIFTKHDVQKHGPYLKVNPPLKSREDLNALWNGLRTGTIDIVTSEHAPGTLDEKEIGWKDIWQAWGGLPSIETMLPVLVSEGVNKGRLTPENLCNILCERPAKTFGLYPRKGVIMIGSDADLTMIDLKQKSKVRSDKLHNKCGWTPYEGMNLTGWPTMTILRGQVVAANGEIIGKSGFGKFLPMRMED
jgi:allantoinase